MGINYIVIRKRSRRAAALGLRIAIVPPPVSFVSNGTYTFEVTASGGTGIVYTWSVTGNAEIISENGTDFITIRVTAAGEFGVSVSAVSSEGDTRTDSFPGTATQSSYWPSLNFTDARNSMYLGTLA